MTLGTPVKKYITDVMKVDTEKEQVYYEEYDPIALKKLIETQHKVIDFQKKNKQKDLFSILIVVDDFSDDPRFVRYSSLLHGLFTRGRHSAISSISSTQEYNVLAPIIRLNTSALFIFRLKNMNEVNAFIEENSALVDKKTLHDMHQQAINDAPDSFFYINTNAKDVNNMFYVRFENALKLILMNRLKDMMTFILYHIMPRIIIDYPNTMFYKIVCKDLDMKDFYVGHTTDFKTRKNCHKRVCNNPNVGNHNLPIYKFIRANRRWYNFDMILIETQCLNDGLEAPGEKGNLLKI